MWQEDAALASLGGSSVDMVWKPTISLKKMVTQSKDSGSTGRPSLNAADTCKAELTIHDSLKQVHKQQSSKCWQIQIL